MRRDENETGRLYVVATPIGNLGDASPRAREVLAAVSVIAAEDTRHSQRLLAHLDVSAKRLVSYHDHNEAASAQGLLRLLKEGQDVALISDAGTPLISDPGYRLLAMLAEEGVEVIAVAGPSALTAALSVAGLPTDRFAFEGFLPAKTIARRNVLARLAQDGRTLVFYEAPHRVAATLADLAAVFGEQRYAAVCRELTKRHEQVARGSLAGLATALEAGDIPAKGEFVLVVAGAPETGADEAAGAEAMRMMTVLTAELPVRQAADLAARLTGEPRNRLYKVGLALRKDE